MPELSVVTITYNDHVGLKDTFSSLDTLAVEWIVIDGSSDPRILELNRELLLNEKVQLIQEPDEGRFDGMNKGLSIARGDLICFLNGGDRFTSLDVPTKVIDSFKNNHWIWAVGETSAIDAMGNKLWNWPMPKHNSLKLIFGINSYCHQATFAQTKVLREIGNFDTDSLYSDWVVSLILSKRAKPEMLGHQTTFFLTEGISSQQTIEYWKRESVRLRRKHDLAYLGVWGFDSFLQWSAAKFISTTRGQLIRPDLVDKYS